MEYIGRHGELEVETDTGEVFKDVAEPRVCAPEWEDDDDMVRKNAVTSISMVLSMPVDTDPDKVLAAARAFARRELEDRYKYVLASPRHGSSAFSSNGRGSRRQWHALQLAQSRSPPDARDICIRTARTRGRCGQDMPTFLRRDSADRQYTAQQAKERL